MRSGLGLLLTAIACAGCCVLGGHALRRLEALEEHLAASRYYGEGPGAEAIANAIFHELPGPNDAVAVHVEPGTPPRALVVVRLVANLSRDPGSYSDDERRALLDRWLAAVDAQPVSAGQPVAIGLTTGFLYRGIVVRRPGAAPVYDLSTASDRHLLEDVLDP